MKGAIFDLDGTLLDSMQVWEEVDRAFFKKRGIEMPPDYQAAITPLGYRATAEYTIERFKLNETPEAVMKEWYDGAIEAYRTWVNLKRGAKEYLEKLHREGVRIAAATASDACFFEPTLRRCGIYELFECFTTTHEVSRGKGFPDVYLKAAEKLGILPQDCTVFEDIYEGVCGAKLGGFKTVAVYEPAAANQEMIKQTADRYIMDFYEML